MTVLLVNNILFALEGESLVAVYAIISRMLMFALFPILGITQGFVPIAGFNYGAKHKERVVEAIRKAIIYASVLATLVFVLIVLFAENIAAVFTSEPLVVQTTADVLTWVFLSTPIVGIQLIGSAYFQAIGKAIPALLLTLTRQGFFFCCLFYPYRDTGHGVFEEYGITKIFIPLAHVCLSFIFYPLALFGIFGVLSYKITLLCLERSFFTKTTLLNSPNSICVSTLVTANISIGFSCFDDEQLVVLFNGFNKKTQKTPQKEIEKAERLMKDYFNSKKQKT